MPALTRREIDLCNPLGLSSTAKGGQRRKEVNGKSILDLTTLAAACGACIDLEASGPDADAAILALAVLIEARSHEAEAQA